MAVAAGALAYDTREVRALLENVRDYAIFVLAADGRVVTWNAGARAIKGYEAAEIVGRHMSEFYTPDDRAAGEPGRLLATAAREGRVEHEGWRVRKDGSRFWADVVITALLDETGTVTGFLKVTRDLTDRRNAELALRSSEESLSATLYSIGDGVIATDARGHITRMNPVAERLSGWPEASALGKPIAEVFHIINEETRAPAVNPVGRVLKEGLIVGLANHTALISRDGTERPIADSGAPIRSAGGEIQGAVLVFRDVSHERKAERALRRSEQELARRAVQQSALAELGLFALSSRELQPILEQAVAIVKKTLGTELGKILALQPDGRTLLLRAGVGWRAGVVGHATIAATPESLAGYVLATGAPVVVQNLAEETRFSNVALLEEHGVVSGLAVVIPIPGEERPFGVFGAHARQPMTFSRDDVSFFQAIANVIASAVARVHAERRTGQVERIAEEEKRRTARAEEAVRERDVFLSVATHELRTPLTALQLKLQGLQQMLRADLHDAPQGERVQERFRDALRQVDRLGELVERLLDVSRMAAGRLQINRSPVDLAALVRDVVADFGEKARQSRTDIAIHTQGDVQGSWDRRRLEQVVLNLLSNAVKYGEGHPVEIRIDGEPNEVKLLVADRGIGIAVDDQARIFDAFERAAPVENFAGLGLGLYITRRILEAHGGSIAVSSTPGQGTTFVVTLPRQT